MVQKAEKIWFDGKLVPWDEAQIHVLTHSLHYGVATFEGIRCYKCSDGSSAVFRLPEHMKRLLDSSRIVEMDVPFSQQELEQAVVETLKVNKQAEAYIRPLVFIGEGAMGVLPAKNPIQVAIITWPWGAYLGAEALEKGIRVRTSSFTRHHVNVMMTKAKVSGNYVNSVLAKRDAVADGYDEALMLDPEGYVSEATGENIFIVKNGKVKTPPLGSILSGITRDSLLLVAEKLGYPVVEQRFTRDELYAADEAFFCGTAAEVTPICQVDRRTIGQGSAGKITKQLQEEYFKIIKGEKPEYDSWLTRYTF